MNVHTSYLVESEGFLILIFETAVLCMQQAEDSLFLHMQIVSLVFAKTRFSLERVHFRHVVNSHPDLGTLTRVFVLLGTRALLATWRGDK